MVPMPHLQKKILLTNHGILMVKIRQSNMELLRILSMFMILNLHSFIAPSILSDGGNLLYTALDYLRETCCICAVNLFVMISGYFGITWKKKSILSLVFQVYFFVLIPYLIFLLFGWTHFSIKDFVLKLNCLTQPYWFVSQYFLLYLIAPILNQTVEDLSKKKYLTILMVFFFVQFYFNTFQVYGFGDGYSVLSFAGIYLLGRYLKKYPPRVCSLTCFGGYILCAICLAVQAMIQKSVTNDLSSIYATFGGIYNHPLVIIETVCLFIVFSRIPIQSKIINYTGSSVLAVYLLHRQPNISKVFNEIIGIFYEKTVFHHFLYQLIFLVSVFVFAIMIDKIRIWIFDKLYVLIENKRK